MTSSPITLSRADKRLILHALVVKDLDVDVLVGTPFMISSDISVSSAKGQVLIQGSNVVSYHSETLTSPHAHAVRRAQSCVLRLTTSTTVVFPGEYLVIDVLPDLGPDSTLAKETRTTHLPKKPHSSGLSPLLQTPCPIDSV